MHIVGRILYWLSLAGLALSLVAPMLFGGADWAEAQPVVVITLLLTIVFGAISAKAVPPAMKPDVVATKTRQRSSSIAYSLITMLVLAVLGTVVEVKTQDELNATHVAAWDDPYHAGAGSWTGVIALVAAGAALISTIAFAATKKPQPAPQAAGAWPGAYQGYPPPQQGYPGPYPQGAPPQGPYYGPPTT